MGYFHTFEFRFFRVSILHSKLRYLKMNTTTQPCPGCGLMVQYVLMNFDLDDYNMGNFVPYTCDACVASQPMQKCGNCGDEMPACEHDDAYCNRCYKNTKCGCYSHPVENSARGRKLEACSECIITFTCIECKQLHMYADSHHEKRQRFRCDACMPGDAIECFKCSNVYVWGNIGAPDRELQSMRTCLHCIVKDGMSHYSWHHLFADPTYLRFKDTVAEFVSTNNMTYLTINDALAVAASTLEALKCDHDVFMSIMMANLQTKRMMVKSSAMAALVLMQWLPNDIRLKILDMVDEHTNVIPNYDQCDGCLCGGCRGY